MKTDIDHLRSDQQRDLHRVVRLLFEEFADAHGEPVANRKLGRILKIILHGRYARDEGHDAHRPDDGEPPAFDLLIIVNQIELTSRLDYWADAEERLRVEASMRGTLRCSVHFIVHTLQQVNDALAHGRDFFVDIAREGIALYQSDDTPLLSPKPKTPADALRMVRDYYHHWFPLASDFYESAKLAQGRGKDQIAVHLYHEAAERLYYCVLLVGKLYTPHVRNLNILRHQADALDRRLYGIWGSGRADKRLFAMLNDITLLDRMKRDFRIETNQLAALAERIEALGQAVQAVCIDRIAALEAEVKETDASSHTGLAIAR
ncbi:nucleotidyltransferase [Sphingobium terrigena]|uniref:Nucleotidyltransferase n=1 Tax=Sphingobium terrigena TaxID=2304063 RepID=A0A418YUM4_9SPHN|nr:nucleotidyltransferase [Sphingobium terrigena]RJG55865.1 nucleotidyltransferase [Sphingobium terrigena]